MEPVFGHSILCHHCVTARKVIVVKTKDELKTEANRIRHELQNSGIINLNELRQFWKNLEEYIQNAGGGQPNLITLADFDWEIIAANAARRRLHAQLFDLVKEF